MTPESNVDRIFFGRVLRALREKRNIDQATIARRVGITQSAVSRYGRGHCVPDTIQFAAYVSAIGETADRVYALAESAKRLAESVTRSTFKKSTRPWHEVAWDVGETGVVGLADFCIAVTLHTEKK